MMRLLVAALLLALPVGLASSLAADALLRVGLWADAASTGLRPGGGDARERIELALETDALVGAALGETWRAAAAASLAAPVPVSLPYAETVAAGASVVDDIAAGAVAFEVDIDPGNWLRVATRAGEGAIGGLVIDVRDAAGGALLSAGPAAFDTRIGPEGTSGGMRVAGASADVVPTGPRRLTVRVQGTPGAVGRFAVRLEERTALDFPVATDAESPVRSFFGMPRDGGRREHHGIDIFAPRGTPVLAAADGLVVRTGDSVRGGLHVWQRAVDGAGDSLGTLYYAHLDRVDVAPGTRVRRGDRLGTVGNTGNARTTPPHLHFGLYRRLTGPVDPLPLTGPRRVATVDPALERALPRWLVVRAARANLRAGPGTNFRVMSGAVRAELVRVDALLAGGAWARVRGGDGTVGWMAASLLRPAEPSGTVPPTVTLDLLATPEPGAPVLGTLDAAVGLGVLGRYGAFGRVQSGDGRLGWVVLKTPAGDG